MSPVQAGDTQVNQGIFTSQSTLAAQSVAGDHSGDFVVTWTRTEPVLDSNGNQVYDPATGAAVQGNNVYARYYTDSAQRLTLPAGVLANAGAGNYGHFSLTYGGDATEQIAFSQATPTLAGATSQRRSRGRSRSGWTPTATVFEIPAKLRPKSTSPKATTQYSRLQSGPTPSPAA